MFTRLSDYDFDLPDALIAQKPLEQRSASRLMLLNRKTGAVSHSYFSKIADSIREGDVLVFNDAKVINARLYFARESGAKAEFVLSNRLEQLRWHAVSNRTKKLKEGEKLYSLSNPEIYITVAGRSGDYLEIETSVPFDENLLNEIGEVPLPPYVRRDADSSDSERYQTVYARSSGAVAAPTAGLHFTDEVMNAITDRGAECVFCTLNVSWGTFSPVREEDIRLHKMHSERYILNVSTCDAVNSARSSGRRIIAVGTTSLRVLESSYDGSRNVPGEGMTDIFIYPPSQIKSADCMITNFHTPKSTLLMLVCAFAGYDNTMNAYREAVRDNYRFFSYGDSMFIEA